MKPAALAAIATLALPLPAWAQIDAVLSDDAVTVTESGKPAFVYRTRPLDPAKEPGRSNYLHPLHAPDGTVLTEDRPADHLHQRGVFWSWHQVLVDGKSIGDGWFMEGLAFDVYDRSFHETAGGRGTLTVKARWLAKPGPQAAHVADETTTVRLHPLERGRRTIEIDTVITARTDSLALGGSDDVKGYGGFSIRLVRPDTLVFGSGGQRVAPQNEPVEAGPAMGFTWPEGQGPSQWVVTLTCQANDQPIKRWILRNSLSMQNCVFPGRAPHVIKKGESLRLRQTLVIRPADRPAQAEKPKT